jgi:hypothetical protein
MHASRFLPALLVAVLALGLAACDAVDAGDTFELDARQVKFDFRFTAGDLTPGSLLEFTSDNSVDLRDYVRQRGFAPEDIVGARVVANRAEFRIARPVAANVGSFSRAEVRTFQGTNRGSVLVSGQGFTGTGSTTQLGVLTTNFGSVVATGPFQAILGLQATSPVVPGDYLIEVTLDIVISVEG